MSENWLGQTLEYGKEKKEKPEFLYHASVNKDISELRPQSKRVRDENEGSVVFATPDYALATVFMTEHNDSWTHSGKFCGIPFFVINGREKFMQSDKGGSIYKISSDGFEFDPNKGMGENEWVNSDPVKIIEKRDYPSALDAMISEGVQVYFVEDDFFAEFNKASNESNIDRMFEMIGGVESENKKLNINVKGFDENEKQKYL